MASAFTPAKRPLERNPLESDGKAKWQKTSPTVTPQAQTKASQGPIVFRILCSTSKTGSLIGKGGGVIAKIRQETGAKIRIEETVPGCEERVVIITGSEKDAEDSKEQNKEKDEENCDNGDGGEGAKAGDENDEKEGFSSLHDSKSLQKMRSLAQRALMLVFERIIEDEAEDDGGDDSSKKASSTCVRLLVLSSQVGCLLGIGGSVIKQMSADSGAQIRILSKEKLPLCAARQDDEIVQFMGAIASVRKALELVSQQLLENSSRDQDSFSSGNSYGPSSNPFASAPRPEALRMEGVPPANHQAGRVQISPEQLTFRLLCPNDKVGSVIGKGGSIIKTIQHETGCEIKIHQTSPESEDRIIQISGPAFPDDHFAPPQGAVFRVQERIEQAVLDKAESSVMLRLLVAANQTGCLLGKGGAVIAEMRKISGAHIRILGKDQAPKFVSESDEVVQVTGEPGAVHEALVQITMRLKHHLFRDKMPSLSHMHSTFVDQMPPHGSYMGRRESPPRMYPTFGSTFQNYDFPGRHIDERSAFPIHGSGVLPHGIERIPAVPWAHQGMRDSGGLYHLPEYMGAAPQRRIGGFPAGSQPAVITNTTIDVVVPRAAIPSIYGDGGGCLKKIREISEARITITESRPEATETVIIISGTPEQTYAAQSLIQGFVVCASGSP